MRKLADRLAFYGMGEVMLYVGENLSYENEKIFCETSQKLTDYRGDALSVVCACNAKAELAGNHMEFQMMENLSVEKHR